MKQYIRWFFVIAICWLPFLIAAWDNTEPADASQWNVCAGYIRNNWNALEVVLGVDLSMEGSASPWYEASAPTKVADGSTALAAANNGLLWVDSDTRILYTYVHGTGFVGTDSVPSVVTFNENDTTPTVALGSTFLTFAGTLTISDFDDGVAGKVITVQSTAAITYDMDTAQGANYNLDGSSADVVTASGDVTVWECKDGTTWNLVSLNDASFDNGAQVALYSELHATTAGYTPASYTGGANSSVTYPNGMIMKMGAEAYSAAQTTVTYTTAFPNAVVSTVVTPYSEDGGGLYITDANTASFVINESDTNPSSYYWLSVGY